MSLDAPVEQSPRGLRRVDLKLKRLALTLLLGAVFLLCWRAAEIRPLALFDAGALGSLSTFLRDLFPPDTTPNFLRVVFGATAQTIALAITGTILSILIGLPLGVLATATLWRRGVLLAGEPRRFGTVLLHAANCFTHAILGFLRAVPDLVWGLLFVAAVGLGSLAGALALAVGYAGVLGRVYADIFEDVDPRPLEALHSTGATKLQIFLRAILPQAAPAGIAYTLYSFECCVRAAAVLGFVGAGGIGYEISLSMRLFEYNQVLTLILALVGLLAVTDAVSRYVRRRLHAKKSPVKIRLTWGTSATRSTPPRRTRILRLLRDRSWIVIAPSLVAFSFYACGFVSGTALDEQLILRVYRFIGAMVPPDVEPRFLRSLLVPLLQTLGISVMGTFLGIIIGALLALPSTSTLVLVDADVANHRSMLERGTRWMVYGSARLISGALRAIPELVWVLVCIIAVGLGPFAGTLAIGLHTGGVLGKIYAEALEEVPARPIEALQSSGAGLLQILVWGMLPQARPTITSFTVLRWEMNLRVSTVLGLVGGGGLGQAIFNNVQLGFYQRVATLILLVYLLVMATDWLADRLRAKPVLA